MIKKRVTRNFPWKIHVDSQFLENNQENRSSEESALSTLNAVITAIKTGFDAKAPLEVVATK
jgi:hypothetical protein